MEERKKMKRSTKIIITVVVVVVVVAIVFGLVVGFAVCNDSEVDNSSDDTLIKDDGNGSGSGDSGNDGDSGNGQGGSQGSDQDGDSGNGQSGDQGSNQGDSKGGDSGNDQGSDQSGNQDGDQESNQGGSQSGSQDGGQIDDEDENSSGDILVDYLIYSLNRGGDSYTVDGVVEEYIETIAEIVIPATYNGLPVTSISKNAIVGCPSLRSIIIGENVTSFGNYAISDCTALTEIKYNATSADDLSPNSYVFSNAGQDGDGITLTIGANVERIPGYMFCPSTREPSCRPEITSLNFDEGSSCTYIGVYAFYECVALMNITIPELVVDMGYGPFLYCTSLSYICFNATNLNVTSYVFGNLGTATDDGQVTVIVGNNVKRIPNSLFYNCAITSVQFDEESQCESIGSNAFYGAALKSLNIPDSVTTIESYAFYGCSSLSSLTLGKNLESIGSYAFYNCNALLSLDIPDSVTSIGSYAFYYCRAMTSLKISANVTSIESYAFYYCSSLKTLVIPEGVTSIGAYAFYGCTTCTSLTIPDGVNSIGTYAFYCCYRVTNIVIPDSVTSIGNYAFAYCYDLESLIIGEGVTSIGTSAFRECYALTDFYFKATRMGDLANYNNVFRQAGVSGTGITLTIASNVERIPAHMFTPYSVEYVPNLKTIIFEENSQCNEVADYAFRYTSSLERIYYFGTPDDWANISIGVYDSYFNSGIVYYYSDIAPDYTDGYKYWHYDATGEMVIWGEEDQKD